MVSEDKGWFRLPISRRKEKQPPPQRTNVFNMLSYNVISTNERLDNSRCDDPCIIYNIYTCICVQSVYFIQVVWNSLKNIYSWSCFNDFQCFWEKLWNFSIYFNFLQSSSNNCFFGLFFSLNQQKMFILIKSSLVSGVV